MRRIVVATVLAVGISLAALPLVSDAAAREFLPTFWGARGEDGGKSNCPKRSAPTIRDSFPQPSELVSRDGRLFVQLRAELVPVEINGQIYRSTVYNGQYPGPTLVMCQGDLVRINVINALDPANYPGPVPDGDDPDIRGETNIHTHGFHVSPRRPSDNIFVMIKPGHVFHYRYKIPRDHPPGFYWYHPHRHGQTNVQDFGGMNGGIIIKGGLDSAPVWRDIPTRDLVINQTALGQGATIMPGPRGPFVPAGTQWFVNGWLNPQIDIQPGELQRWRIGNTSAGSFLLMQLEGQPFQVLATDGNYLREITNEDTMLIGPSSRREILVVGPPAGTYALKQLPFAATGGTPGGEQTLATLNSSGPAVTPEQPPRELPDQQRDMRDDPINSRHEITYTQEPPNFFINGEQFTGPDNVMVKLELNKTSEWTVRNTTTFWHTFHIHINDFQLTEINGQPVDRIEFDDNFSIPPGESFTMRYRPTDFTGKFVFHCHVLGHEDNGMMAVVQVVKHLRDGDSGNPFDDGVGSLFDDDGGNMFQGDAKMVAEHMSDQAGAEHMRGDDDAKKMSDDDDAKNMRGDDDAKNMRDDDDAENMHDDDDGHD
jgi:FtsP/CotA-like multicopper oxidase with cupredoxin domain